MGLYDKLEEIRKKPEHIRLRYVWAMVTISMIFILAIWFFSLKSEQASAPSVTDGIGNSEIVNQFNAQKDSLQNTVNGVKNAMQNQANQNEQ